MDKESFVEKFHAMCVNSGIIDQLITKGYMIDEVTFGKKALPWLDSVPEDDSFIEEYRKLFSSKAIGKAGKTGSPGAVKQKMNNFVKQYEYSKEVILRAAKKHIEDNLSDPTYIMDADNFIFKDDKNKITKSKLLSYCESVEDEGEEIATWREL